MTNILYYVILYVQGWGNKAIPYRYRKQKIRFIRRKAYEQYLLEQQQKDNPNPQPPKEEIPPKEPINQPNDNIPQGGVEPNNKEYMEYMNKKAQEEMEQREYLARMTPKQREQYEKEMYLREQEYYRQMQNAYFTTEPRMVYSEVRILYTLAHP